MLRDRGRVAEVELDVERLLDARSRDAHLDQATRRVADLLRDPARSEDVVLRTSRTLVAGRDAAHSLDIARSVSAALVATVRSVLASVRPAFVLAKGGITSSDTATRGLGIRRAWSRGPCSPARCPSGSRSPAPPRDPLRRLRRQRRRRLRPSRRCDTTQGGGMLSRGTAILTEALAAGRAVGAFATYNLEQVQAVVAAGRPPACR
ncbi:nucleotide-binding domain containing protein [Streptomyces sp. M19]